MHISTAVLALLSSTALALPRRPTLRPRQQDCKYYPNQTEPVEYSTAAYILRLESHASNTTLGYLDAFSSPYALLTTSQQDASQAFNAPDWNTNEALIFWNGNQTTERGFNLDSKALAGPGSIAEVTTQGCGTRTEGLEGKYADRGSCGMAGQKVVTQLGCPSWGTTNDAGQKCVDQRFFLCNETKLSNVADETKVVYFGVAATAQYGSNCQEVDLVSECP